VLGDVRGVVAAYEAVVRRYPASGYSDNALWQAGQLSLDAFARFGQPSDRDTGVRLLKKLAISYPTSRLARQVPEQIARVESSATARRTGSDERTTTAARPWAAAAPPKNERSIAASAAPPVLELVERRAHRGARDPPPARSLATIKDIRRIVLPDAVRITIELDCEVAFHEERIQDPARVFVDLSGTPRGAVARRPDAALRRRRRYRAAGARLARHPNNTTRVVLDAAGRDQLQRLSALTARTGW